MTATPPFVPSDIELAQQARLRPITAVAADLGLRCVSLLTLDTLIDILANPVHGAIAPAAEHLAALRDYRAQYGVTASL